MTPAVTVDAVDAFVARAREAGHPVEAAGSGLWPGLDNGLVVGSPLVELAPNEILDSAREAARRQVDWVHVVLPTLTDAVRLAAAVQPTPPAASTPDHAEVSRGPAWLRLIRRPSGDGISGDPRRVPFAQLVAEIPLTVRTLTVNRHGHSVHVTEIPAAWIDRPLTPMEALR